VIVRGRGRMEVAGDTEHVTEGDLVFIPPAAEHGIVNDGSEPLVYISAASPPVSMAELYSEQLAPEMAGYDDED
jgi:mannose-6-phosphate isomerase-like protein (cupin superfamily)